MVVSKRKKDNKEIAPPTPELKRTKIQAQRKFPQGQVPPSSAYLTYNLTAGNETPKEKSPEKELLPNLRPNTEDFLTFLCFRGTSSLPKELDFTNSLSNQPSTSGTASATRINNNEKKRQDKTESSSKKKVNNTSITNNNNNNSNNSIKINKNDEATKVTSSDKEKKNDEQNPQTSTSEKKETKKSFMPFAVRKRAEIHPVRNDKKKAQNSNNKKKQNLQKEHKSETLNDNKEVQNEQQRVTRSNPVEEKSLQSFGNKRRSQNNEESSDSYALNTKNIKLDKSPRIELTPIEKVPIETLKKDSKINVNIKKKIQNSDQVKRQTRLSALRNPPNSSTNEKRETSKNNDKLLYDSEKYFFSSEDDDDDDQPLLKSDSNNDKKKKKVQANNKNRSKFSINKSKTNSKNTANKPANEVQSGIKNNKKKDIEQSINEEVVVSDKSVENDSRVENDKTIIESTSMPEKKKVGRKKKTQKEIEKDKDNSQANTTDLSENETRSRPMRKTKEAATIYMELIGRKLTLHDSSDNDSSLDSLEVPNLKRVELLENELKANVGKAKVSAEAERKRNEDKKGSTSVKKTTTKIEMKNTKVNESATKNDDDDELQKNVSFDDKKFEKSFSDSDEEPLATKVIKNAPLASKATPKKRGRKSNQELAEIARKAEEQRQADKLKQQIKELSDTKIETTPKQSSSVKLEIVNPPIVSIPQETKMSIQNEVIKSTFDEIKDSVPRLVKSQEITKTTKNHEVKVDIQSQNDDDFVKGFDTNCTKPISAIKSSINLLPSKEESEKIFGIASVTLAQSSGPLDTKCTLGKCGSIHKPSLGPAVLTESALGNSLSPKDRRKSKVNMTREQIQKWLDEASWTPIPDDEMESIDLKTTSKASTSSAILSKSGDESQSSTITKEKIVDQSPSNFNDQVKQTKSESISLQKLQNSLRAEIGNSKTVATKIEENIKKKDIESQNVSFDSQASNSAIKSPVNDKKIPIYQTQQQIQQQQRRAPVYKATVDKPATKTKLTPIVPSSFAAFSPENEHSIYSFDREDDDFPTPTTPFRRSNSKTDDNNKRDNESQTKATPSKSIQPSHVSLTLSPEDNKKSASISVGVPDDHKKENSSKVDVQEKDDSDSEGHTFYIPLQASNTSSGNKTIQGVAVKLGTEGAEGPNQRIIMHAKLVTKSKINSTPIPESMTNMQELVKTLMASKETSKPIQTVQPRFKSNEAVESVSTSLQPEPSTSSLVANQRTKQTTKLGVMNEAPIFRPTEKEFQDPIEYIERITPLARRFGICRIIPPETFKPECRVSDEMRFTAYNQYVHKMLHRWGPSAKEFAAIKKYLATQSIIFQRPPLIAGIEVDLPRLYHTVQELGGLKEVIEKKKWAKVAEDMCIPKSAHDRVTKLDDIYCKYLLPYDTLSPNERQKLFDEVEADWAKREAKARRNADKGVDSDEQNDSESDEQNESDDDEECDDNESMECMVKGRSMALSQFYRIARNMVTLWFKTPEPVNSEIETEYWRHVAVRDSHVCVHYGSIDSSAYGYGFPAHGPKTKLSPCAKHPWNLKVLTNNCGSILRSLGPVMGVTVPTLHVGMLFSAVCWYRDPHGLPWIEYLHTGASKIWYAVPDEQSSNFRSALTSLVPSHCQNKTIWLPCDTTMVPPYMLTDRNVSLCRTEQQPGQFVVVFPRAYTSSVCTGYTVSESVYFATHNWLDTAHLDFKDVQESCEPMMFSLEQLLFAIANDQRSKEETIKKILPMLKEVFDMEKKNRNLLKESGVNAVEKIHEIKKQINAEELECNYCRANLHISWIKLDDDEEENNVYCLKHALRYINDNRIQANQCKLMYTYTTEEIEKLIKKLKLKVVVSDENVGHSSSTAVDSQQKSKGKLHQKGKATSNK
ncbi:unnamed protein product [Chironomus riparius]|uniref:Protein Jumonji n=1 Tax=Chironomus riparius TaxID=315576 RepID=A0A9N9WPN1_9DIPT|nr:unnamed protein product [Chironomus riparius]